MNTIVLKTTTYIIVINSKTVVVVQLTLFPTYLVRNNIFVSVLRDVFRQLTSFGVRVLNHQYKGQNTSTATLIHVTCMNFCIHYFVSIILYVHCIRLDEKGPGMHGTKS